MRTATVTTVLDAPREAVFDYLADPENLPRWATEFARELRRDEEGYTVVNGLGAFRFEIRANRDTGVVDMFAGPDRHHMAVFPTRAIGLPDGRTAYTFTMFQGPDMSDDLFDAQHGSLQREFANIERVLNR
jgi:Polyketide cyclase / dehydrase and lipid transport